MNIILQIKSLSFSFIFGFIFAFIIGLFYKLIYNKNKFFRLISSLILVLLGVIVYFLILKKINNAIFHVYEVLSIIVGYTLEIVINTYIVKKTNRWYNYIIGE